MTPSQNEIFARAHQNTPQLTKLLKELYQEELNILPSLALDKVQKHQGRTLMLGEIIAKLEGASGNSANR